MMTKKTADVFSSGPTADAIAALPEQERSAVRAAADALRREPLAAPWAALTIVLSLATPPPSCDDIQTPPAASPGPALHHRVACAAMAMLAVRALRRRVLAAASREEPDWKNAAFREREAGVMSARHHGLAFGGPGWCHVVDLQNMLPTFADAERPAAALAEHLLENREARIWWGLHEHELRAALERHDPDAAAAAGQPDEVQAAVDRARHALAAQLGVSPQRVLIMVAF